MSKIIRAMSLWREKYETANVIEKFRLISYLYLDSNYVWGTENPKESDCSGLICGILTFMGHPVRVTATELLKKVFTIETGVAYNPLKIKAGFFVANKDYETPSGIRKKGTVRHVGFLYGKDLFFHSTYPDGTIIQDLGAVKKKYQKEDTSFVIRELNWDSLDKMEGEIYGLDPELV